LFVIDLSKLKKYDATFYTMTHLTFNDVNDILLGTGKLKFGFHPVSILRILFSINHFDDKVIQKILRKFIFQHSKIETRHSGYDIGNILSLIKKTNNVQGDIIELGTWLGGFTVLIAEYLNLTDIKKHIITCDSFEGMPEKMSTGKRTETGTLLKVDHELVKEKFKKFHVDDRITIVKGFIEESLPTITNKTFSFAFIDTAAYDSMKVGLEFIFPRLSINGIVAVDDYSKSDQEYATKQAVDEFCEAHNLKLNLKPFAHILKEI